MARETEVAVAVGLEPAPAKTKKFNVVGLANADTMPIEHNGVMYDLAKLTDEQGEALVKGGCPFVVDKR